ncbi:hypothetical protein CPB83DRAFT_862765 [Crepidotus variabilis]|uniref:F-box domain-containing protein n=1 Tax=Crepidotus variabilis TaxID=179855 RepID=A0A9P6E6N1_9AGAR|nr:hypothetical protein CPB83DRAFT_862765 [Crepidotus variabilis]
MTPCPHCRLDCGAAPKIRREVAESCLRSRDSPCLACQKLLEIEQKIEETRRTLLKLLTEKDELASAVNEHHDPFLNQLPAELVSHVFALSRPYLPSLNIFDPENFDEHTNIQGVLNPGQVCRNWRSIAHRSPELWTVFGVRIKMNPCASAVQLSLEWLERSGICPLFMWLDAEEPPNGHVSQPARDFLTLVAQHAHRWKVLNLYAPIEIVPILCSATEGNGFGHLQHLLIDTRIEQLDGPYQTDLPVSPLWLTVEPSCGLESLLIDWSRLTRFLGFFNFQCTILEFVHLFNNAPNLLACHVGTVTEIVDPAMLAQLRARPNTLVTHNSLRTLRVGTCETNLWNYFDFPSLKKLCLGYIDKPEVWISLRDFLRRSSCKITDLRILGYPSQVIEILQTLKLTTHVERLGIQRFELADCLLPEISNIFLFGDPERSNPELLPKLGALIFYYSEEASTRFNWSSLNTFIVAGTSRDRKKLESV